MADPAARRLPPDVAARHDRLYEHAWKLAEPRIVLGGRPIPVLGWWGRWQLRRAAGLFRAALRLVPENWPALFALAKVHQRLEEHATALGYLRRAHDLAGPQPDVAREACIEAMESGAPEEAIGFAESALRASPDDPGLRANLALSHLLAGHPDVAEPIVRDALGRDPSNALTARLAAIVGDVRAGRRDCPRRPEDAV